MGPSGWFRRRGPAWSCQLVTGRGRWDRWRTCWACRCWFPLFPPAAGGNKHRLHETHLPGRILVQPVQLSLLPEAVPAPLPELISQLPGPQAAAAITLLAGLIARAHAAVAAEAGD